MSQCELLERCGFFRAFKGNSEVVTNGWIKMFCENVDKSEYCERKKTRTRTGVPPEDNVAPTGNVIGVRLPGATAQS
jgi:hypothetical protein